MRGNIHNPTAVKFRAREQPSGFNVRFPLALKIGFWFCIVIAVAVVIRRVVALSTPPSTSAPPQLAGLDAWFSRTLRSPTSTSSARWLLFCCCRCFSGAARAARAHCSAPSFP